MGGHYNKEINNFQRGRSNLDRLNRQNQAFQQKNKQRRKTIDARAEIIANSKIDNGVSAFGVETFDPKMQAYVQDLEQKYGLTSVESFPQLTEAVIPTSLFEEIPETVNTFIKKADFAPALVKKVQTVVEKAAPQGEKSTSTWASNLVKELKAANITVTETFMDRLMDFLGNNKVLKPLTAAMVMMTLALTSCKPIEASNTNEPPAAETAQIPAEEDENSTSTSVATAESGSQEADPGDEESTRATEEAKLSAAQLEDEIDQAGEAVNVEVTASPSFAEELYKLDYISPSTDKDILINESTGRPYVKLNDASPYGPAGTLITPGIGSGVLFISGEANNLSNIRIEGSYIAMGTAEDGSTWVVDAETGNWVPQAEGKAETSIPGAEISAEARVAYTDVINRYYPELTSITNEILQEINTAKSFLNGEIPYPEEYSNERRQVFAFAIVVELEKQRGIQPLYYEKDGVTYYYNQDTQKWQNAQDTEEVRKNATESIFKPYYLDGETGQVYYYWNGRWSLVNGDFDLGEIIDKNNMNNGTMDFTNEQMVYGIENEAVSYVPMICLDDEESETELWPIEKKGEVVFYHRMDFLLLNMDKGYGVNVKLVPAGTGLVYYPNTTSKQEFKSLQLSLTHYNGLFEEGNVYYLGIAYDHNYVLDHYSYAQPIIENQTNTDLLFANDPQFWENLKNSSFVSARPVYYYDPN